MKRQVGAHRVIAALIAVALTAGSIPAIAEESAAETTAVETVESAEVPEATDEVILDEAAPEAPEIDETAPLGVAVDEQTEPAPVEEDAAEEQATPEPASEFEGMTLEEAAEAGLVDGLGLTFDEEPPLGYTNGHTRDQAVSWANSQVGKALDYDGAYGAQCVDLVYYYYTYLGQAAPGGNANQFGNGGRYTPSGWYYASSPQPGDIAVWTGGQYGHVGIVVQVSGSRMLIVEQNYAGKMYGTSNWHNIDAQKYIRPDFASPTVTVNFSPWENGNYTFVSERNAAIGQQIDVSGGTATDSGMVLYDNNRNKLAQASNGSFYYRIYFNINQELGYTLTPGTTYQYRFWAVVNGTKYWSGYQTFRMGGTSTVSIANATVSLSGYSFACTGSAITPSVTVRRNGTTLTRGTDYTVSYRNNVNVGTATVIITGKGNYTGSTSATFQIVKAAPALVPVYRMYNTKTSEHLWTKSKAEYDACGSGNYRDWRAEGVAWYAPSMKAPASYAASTQGDYVYVWRLYDKGRTGDHIYLTYGSEMQAYLRNGWVVDKGAGFWSIRDGATITGRTVVPVYRQYNGGLKRGKSHYTPSKGEYDANVSRNGWTGEGIKFYVVK